MMLELSLILFKGEAQPQRGVTWVRTHGYLSPQHKSPSQANSKTWSHAQSSLAKFAFHLIPISSRDESIRTTWAGWGISASQTGNPPLHFKSIHILMGRVNGTDLSPVAVSYLLWGREAAPHWLGWMSTSWHTLPPRPRHLRFRSTGREDGHT